MINSSVPANGVLRISQLDGVTVRVFRPDGSEVAGSFVAPGVWRPDEPFAVGTYTADLNWEGHESWADDSTFEVIPAVEPSPDFIQLAVSSSVEPDWTQVLQQVCCLAGESRSTAPCEGGCPPLCVPTVYAGKQVVMVEVKRPSDDLQWQLVVTQVETLQPEEFQEGYWDVTSSPDQLCGVVEVFSWLDESTAQVRACIPNPRPDLTPVEEMFISFGNNGECTIPPTGYEAQWCDGREYNCEALLSTPENQQDTETKLACEHYAEVCTDAGATDPSDESETPVVTDSDAATDSTAEAPDTASSGDSPDDTREDSSDGDNELAEPKLRRVAPSKGCSVSLMPTRSSWALVHRLTFVVSLGWLMAFRRKRR